MPCSRRRPFNQTDPSRGGLVQRRNRWDTSAAPTTVKLVTSEPGETAEAGPHAHGRDAAGQALTAPVPVLLITGPVGARKSTVAAEAARLLLQAHIPHAL